MDVFTLESGRMESSMERENTLARTERRREESGLMEERVNGMTND